MTRLMVVAMLVALGAASAAAEERIELPSRPGVTQPILYGAASQPFASAVIFVGGNGVILGYGNFLLRIRGDLVAAGISVAAADAPSDHRGGLDTAYRSSADAAADAAAIVAFLKSKAAVPVWLIGTSRGSISAANGAARLGPPSIAGVILTSSVWSGGMSAVPLGEIKVPTLIVHNDGDTCPQSPYVGATAALGRLTGAPVKELVTVSSHAIRGPACEPMAPHGYLGIEGNVAAAMVAWMKAHPR